MAVKSRRKRRGDAVDYGPSGDDEVLPGTGVRVLGPVEVVGPRGTAMLVGARQRALVGLLALNAGTVVARPRLVDALWGEDPPRTAVKTLHSHVARVRQALDACGMADSLATRDPGYVLAVAPAAVDVFRFEEHLKRARQELAVHAPDRAVEELRAALGLWRGDALADAEPAGWAVAEVARLHDGRLSAYEELAGAQLRLGLHGRTVGELERLLVMYPLRERLVELLMLALYRSGRHTDALDACQRLRARLADELGCDPGPEVQRLYTRILQRDPALDVDAEAPQPYRPLAQAPKPAQLPPRVGHFTGRIDELRTLDQLLDDAGDARTVVVSGPAGMGKTALTVEWAHRVKGRFPDGQLFLDLRGHDRHTAMSPGDALSRILRSLRVPADRIPADLSEQAGLYRSLLDDRQVLVVLDNGGTVEHVLPLVPASPGSLLLVTSRNPMTALATYHAVRAVNLELLDRGDALALLGQVLGAGRIEAEPADAAQVVELCGQMPLALRIAAAKLAARRGGTIRELAADLAREDRLDALAVEGDSRSVRTVFASACRALTEPAERMFRILGLHPGLTVSTHLAAAAAGVTLDAADRAMAELVAAHLITEIAAGRYRFHDLIRLYAHERAQVDEAPQQRAEAIDRILDWYLAIADAASRTLGRDSEQVVPSVRYPPVQLPFPPVIQETFAFLDDERDNLVPIVEHAAARGHVTTAWQLTFLLTGFYDSRGHWGERVTICRAGLDAARQLGDPGAEGLMHSGLGVAHIMTRRFDEALECLYLALPLMRASGDKRGEGHVHNNIAVANAEQRHFDDAVEAFEQALALHTANGHAVGIALAQSNIGEAYIRMGRAELSVGYLAQALTICREIGNPWLEARALHNIGQASAKRGDHPGAMEHLGAALAVRRRIGDRRHEVETLNDLGMAHLMADDHEAALDNLRQALELSREIVDEHAEASTLNNIGRAHLSSGNLVAAREYLRLAVGLRTHVPDAYEEANIALNVGDLEHAGGDPAAARRHWDQAILLYGKANATAEADELLSRGSG
jgi:DNA-binding SARP family transcriptional activator/tetratricopeptide (TPR) repeat protein